MSIESTARGVFFLAGLKAGIFSNKKEIVERIEIERTFHPAAGREKREALLNGWRSAVERAVL